MPDPPVPDAPVPDPHEQPWTVLRLLEWTSQFFRSRGSESPRLDAEVLLAHVRDCDRIHLYTAFADVPDEDQRARFRELVRRRGEGTPVAYLVGYREFYSFRLRVDEHVLIPRPETEHVVVLALEAAKRFGAPGRATRIADVGTGSGAIAIAIAKHLASAQITATDISPEALRVAQANAAAVGVADRIDFVAGDLLTGVEPDRRFEIICSNPPYVSEAEYRDLDRGVRDFEPRSALVAGPTGSEVIRRLIPAAAERLVDGGELIIELSPMIAQGCFQIVANDPAWVSPRLTKDLEGHARVLSATRHQPTPAGE